MQSISAEYEIDHVFICTSAGGSEADQLVAFGLTEGSRNHHPGQGTANRRFFFENAMLELLWVEDGEEVRSEAVRRLALWERWSQRNLGASPFGICYRPQRDAAEPAPFESWIYRPPYMPIAIAVSTASADPRLPLLFYLPLVRETNPTEPCAHANGIRKLSSAVVRGSVMEMTFDGGSRGAQHDFRPHLPLKFIW
jgi:hypothetical protein